MSDTLETDALEKADRYKIAEGSELSREAYHKMYQHARKLERERLVRRTAFFESSIGHDRADSIFRFLVENGYSATVKQQGRMFVIEADKIEPLHPTNHER